MSVPWVFSLDWSSPNVSINGYGFLEATAVYFGGTAGTFSIVDDTHINAVMPDSIGPGVYYLTVTTPAGVNMNNSASMFVVQAPDPTDFWTYRGGYSGTVNNVINEGRQEHVLSCYAYAAGAGTYSLEASGRLPDGVTLSYSTSALLTGGYDIDVSITGTPTECGIFVIIFQAVGTDWFTPPPNPYIIVIVIGPELQVTADSLDYGITPFSGNVGTICAMHGSGFLNVTGVLFGVEQSTPAEFTINSDSQLTVVTPPTADIVSSEMYPWATPVQVMATVNGAVALADTYPSLYGNGGVTISFWYVPLQPTQAQCKATQILIDASSGKIINL